MIALVVFVILAVTVAVAVGVLAIRAARRDNSAIRKTRSEVRHRQAHAQQSVADLDASMRAEIIALHQRKADVTAVVEYEVQARQLDADLWERVDHGKKAEKSALDALRDDVVTMRGNVGKADKRLSDRVDAVVTSGAQTRAVVATTASSADLNKFKGRVATKTELSARQADMQKALGDRLTSAPYARFLDNVRRLINGLSQADISSVLFLHDQQVQDTVARIETLSTKLSKAPGSMPVLQGEFDALRKETASKLDQSFSSLDNILDAKLDKSTHDAFVMDNDSMLNTQLDTKFDKDTYATFQTDYDGLRKLFDDSLPPGGSRLCINRTCVTESQLRQLLLPRKVDCTMGSWTTCSAPCGPGTQSRSVTQPSAEGGAACGPTSQACNNRACPVDCEMGTWSTCSAICGPGTQTRSITKPAEYTGAACGVTSQACNKGAC